MTQETDKAMDLARVLGSIKTSSPRYVEGDGLLFYYADLTDDTTFYEWLPWVFFLECKHCGFRTRNNDLRTIAGKAKAITSLIKHKCTIGNS